MKKNYFVFMVIIISVLQTTVYAQYNVGSNDGFAYNSADYNPLSYWSVYSVGNNDGFAYNKIGSWGNEVPLPIQLLWFFAEYTQPNVTLKWATASEINNDFFTLERSLDCVKFYPVGTIPGNSNSSKVTYYSYTDTATFYDIVYYRLKQTDFDGTSQYSNLVPVNCFDEITRKIQAYPNPVTNVLTIEITGNSKPVNVEIINPAGVIISKESIQQISTIPTSHLTAGTYVIKFENGKTYEFKKIIKN